MANGQGQDARPIFFFDIDNCVSICPSNDIDYKSTLTFGFFIALL